MSIIDDWLRQHPNLTLSRDQRETLEELIDDEIDENEVGCGEDFADLREDDDLAKRVIFTRGAKAMRSKITGLYMSRIPDRDGMLGVGFIFGTIAEAIAKMETPEPMPEDLEDEEET